LSEGMNIAWSFPGSNPQTMRLLFWPSQSDG
jgi:hypothetical protein